MFHVEFKNTAWHQPTTNSQSTQFHDQILFPIQVRDGMLAETNAPAPAQV